jgi:hypothetical protein
MVLFRIGRYHSSSGAVAWRAIQTAKPLAMSIYASTPPAHQP